MSGSINIFHNYNNNNYFIETGSYQGRGIRWALEAGFKNIISIEITPLYYGVCKSLYKDDKNVAIMFGDSVNLLPMILKGINEPITFWLDGHYTDTTTNHNGKFCPLLDELAVISYHEIKNHTILIDDMRCWNEGNPLWENHYGFGEKEIKESILNINKLYKFTYENGFVPNDILVATI